MLRRVSIPQSFAVAATAGVAVAALTIAVRLESLSFYVLVAVTGVGLLLWGLRIDFERRLEHRHEVLPNEATIPANQRDYRVSLAEGQVAYFVKGVQEHALVSGRPIELPAGRAGRRGSTSRQRIDVGLEISDGVDPTRLCDSAPGEIPPG